jgi:hypothetical protein
MIDTPILTLTICLDFPWDGKYWETESPDKAAAIETEFFNSDLDNVLDFLVENQDNLRITVKPVATKNPDARN